MGNSNEKRKKDGIDFQVKHGAFLDALRNMPKSERWNYFNAYAERESFLIELMEAYCPKQYAKIKKRLGIQSGLYEEGKDSDAFLESQVKTSDVRSDGYREELNSEAFMEGVKEAIENYTGKTKSGEEVVFVACFGTIYKHRNWQNIAKDDLGDRGVSDQEISEDKLCRISKLLKKAKEIYAKNCGRSAKEKVFEWAVAEISPKCTKEEKEIARGLFFSGDIFSMDQPLNEEKGTLKDILMDEKNPYDKVAYDDESSLLKMMCERLEEKWELVRAAKGLRERENIKIFLTQGILKELKLDETGNVYLLEPAGNESFYLFLKPEGDFLYNKLFYQEYLRRAFVENPENFYEVYALFLREDFNFSDKLLGEIVGKDKTAISKGKKQYYKMMKNLCGYKKA